MKVIEVKSGAIKAGKNGKQYVELVNTEGKTDRIFQSMQRADGSWAHLEDEVNILIEKIANEQIAGMKIGLTKQQKDKYWNVVAVDFNPPQELVHIKTTVTPKPNRVEYRGRDEDKVDTRTAIMEIGADYRDDKRDYKDPLVMAREVWLMGIMGVTETKF